MRAVTRLRKRAAVLVIAAVVALGATACLPDTGPPPADALQLSLFNALNHDRVANGLPAFTWSPKLAMSAGVHSGEMTRAGYMFHSDLNFLLSGSDWGGFWTLGENVIVGPGNMTSTDMVRIWMNSPPHRANILSWNFNTVGVGLWYSADGRLWATAIFGGHY